MTLSNRLGAEQVSLWRVNVPTIVKEFDPIKLDIVIVTGN